MTVWVDADACPVVIKDILFRAAEKNKLRLILVANQPMSIPKSQFIGFLQVQAGFDEADNEIVRRLESGDLVVTSDIPLAAEVVARQATALSPRGELYTEDNIQARLSMRNFMESLRSSGVETGGPGALTLGDRQEFANHLDRWIRQQS